jgi:hypothetical protein
MARMGWRMTGDAAEFLAVAGAFLHTPPHPVLLTPIPAGAAEDLAATLADRPLAGVNGHVEAAGAFAASSATGSATAAFSCGRPTGG